MSYSLSAECPCCNKIASNDLIKIEELFGFRLMSNKKKIPQSYCRICRSKKCSPNAKKC